MLQHGGQVTRQVSLIDDVARGITLDVSQIAEAPDVTLVDVGVAGPAGHQPAGMGAGRVDEFWRRYAPEGVPPTG